MRRLLGILLALAISSSALAQPQRLLPIDGRIDVSGRFTDLAEQANLVVPGKVEKRDFILSGGIARAGFLLHPTAAAEDTVLNFPASSLRDFPDSHRTPVLLFYIGMQDEIPWGATTNTPNGARFSVLVDGDTVFEETLADNGWRFRAVDLAPFMGSQVNIAVAVNAIDGNSSYDWAHFAEMQLVWVEPKPSLEALGRLASSPGVAFAWLRASEPSTVRVTCGDVSIERAVPTGSSIITVPYEVPGEIMFQSLSGGAVLMRSGFAAWSESLEAIDMYTKPRVVFTEEPFELIARVRNNGLGAAFPDTPASMESTVGRAGPSVLSTSGSGDIWPPDSGMPRGDEIWQPNETRALRWKLKAGSRRNSAWASLFLTQSKYSHFYSKNLGVALYEKGLEKESNLPASIRSESESIHAHRDLGAEGFSLELRANWHDSLSLLHYKGQTIATLPMLGAIEISEQTFFSMLDSAFVSNDGQSEFPNLYSLGTFDKIQDLFSGVESVSSENRRLHIELDYKNVYGPFYVDLAQTKNTSRSIASIHYKPKLFEDAATPLEFGQTEYLIGPTLFFGDRNPDARRDFAIFPGLEFLEGSEGSSSERDLAPPLNDRKHPELYKITAPFMAVEGNDVLIGIMWDAAQSAAVGAQMRPAVFDAPAYEPGFAAMRPILPIVPDKATGEFNADFQLVLEDRAAFEKANTGQDTSRAAFLLDMYRHYFEVFGMPAPSPQPRGWEAERALCADAYLNAVGSGDPAGFRHCAGWDVGAFSAHAVPARLLLRAGLPEETAAALSARVDAVVARAVNEGGPAALASNAAAHIVNGETPFFEGHVGEALLALRAQAYARLEAREDGLWRWQPATEKHKLLGKAGDHTLGQAALGARMVLRAARLTGNLELRRQALDCLKQMEQYAVPRGAQTWECPLYQPDILAAAHAISAYMDAYYITGDRQYIVQAAYWAKTGLPFIYFWSPTGDPAMLYNTIPVFGSTWFTHTWIGVPVVWCGLVYAYALQDLAPFDSSFDWRTIAQGITNSAMHQQYTEGPSKGCYPDSWNVLEGTPNPADINPENIVLNECRLRGEGGQIRTERVPARVGEALVNSVFDIEAVFGHVGEGKLGLMLRGRAGFPAYTAVVPAQEPQAVAGAGPRAANSVSLAGQPEGWLYDREAQALILKNTPATDAFRVEVTW